ncbi:hypothetical protein PALI_a1728 [Pseudoalteromonas aliena SW19]|uniref:Uncharacterized protein n=1 Tax=Pseudoalteromonas aliena SW19 TaxID=1314866 RepID=A0ABR9DXZ4_9GAMM|nr:hypothetical protein [Pseudoalteromonas aliena SW19]
MPAFTAVLADFSSSLRDNSAYVLFHSEMVHSQLPKYRAYGSLFFIK